MASHPEDHSAYPAERDDAGFGQLAPLFIQRSAKCPNVFGGRDLCSKPANRQPCVRWAWSKRSGSTVNIEFSAAPAG
jgi:hypothetical protein